jgi:hypothetical protein
MTTSERTKNEQRQLASMRRLLNYLIAVVVSSANTHGICTIEVHGQMCKILQIMRFWKTKAAGSAYTRYQCILEFSIT